MKWYHLSPIQWVILLLLVVLADLFTYAQNIFLPEPVRPVSYFVFVILVLLAFFFIVRPDEPFVLAGTLCVIMGVITTILIVVQDVILANTLSWKTVIVFSGVVLGPLIAGYCYRLIRSSAKA